VISVEKYVAQIQKEQNVHVEAEKHSVDGISPVVVAEKPPPPRSRRPGVR
jgi:hypothetical protein